MPKAKPWSSTARMRSTNLEAKNEPNPHKNSRAHEIKWASNPQWTVKMIAYLSDHPVFRISLFLDSTRIGILDKPKMTARQGKTQQYITLAKAVFEGEETLGGQYALDPARFALSVETRLRRLKTEHQKFLKELLERDPSFNPSEVVPGSDIANYIDEFRAVWPWWDELHAFWRDIPSYMPVGTVMVPENHNGSVASNTDRNGHTDSGGEGGGNWIRREFDGIDQQQTPDNHHRGPTVTRSSRISFESSFERSGATNMANSAKAQEKVTIAETVRLQMAHEQKMARMALKGAAAQLELLRLQIQLETVKAHTGIPTVRHAPASTTDQTSFNACLVNKTGNSLQHQSEGGHTSPFAKGQEAHLRGDSDDGSSYESQHTIETAWDDQGMNGGFMGTEKVDFSSRVGFGEDASGFPFHNGLIEPLYAANEGWFKF